MAVNFDNLCYNFIKKISVMRQTSVNDLVEQILSEYAAAHEDEIQRYEEVFGGDK